MLAMIPGDRRLSFRKVRDAKDSKKVKFAPYEDAEKYSGYPLGGTPMVFHNSKMKTLIDIKLTEYDSIIGGGGTNTRLIEMRVSDVIRLNDAIALDITE
jgi:prolyl-tRNA editing enzyme YbaK/EbsC (Cys-tRNA(Pro) deacylase)